MPGGITIIMVGDDAKLDRAVQKQVAKAKKLEDAYKNVEKAGQSAGDKTAKAGKRAASAGDAASEAFGKRAAAGIAQWATGIVSATAALGAMKAALAAVRKEADEAGNRIVDAESGRRALLQISGGDAKRFALDKRLSEQLRVERGFTQTEADQLVFDVGSAGLRKDITTFADLRDVGFNPQAGVTAVQKLTSAFGGSGRGDTGAGGTRDIINKVLAAAAGSPVGGADIARTAAIASTSFAAIGGGDEGLLATLAELTKTFRSPEAAGERIKSLADQIDKKRASLSADTQRQLEGKQGLELIDTIASLSESGELKLKPTGKDKLPQSVTAQEFLAESNAVQAFRAIGKQRQEIAATLTKVRQAETTTGTGKDLLSGFVGIGEQDALITSARKKRISEQGLAELQEEKFGEQEGLADALEANLKAQRLAEGTDSTFDNIRRGISTGILKTKRFIGGNQSFLDQFAQFSDDPTLQGNITTALQRTRTGPAATRTLDELAASVADLSTNVKELTAETKNNTEATRGNTTATGTVGPVPLPLNNQGEN